MKSEKFHHQLRDEIEILENYLSIEKVRFGNRLNVVFNISRDAADVQIPSLLLQPLIENNIKHAVGKHLSQTTIRIDATVEASRLQITLSDNGAEKASNPARAAIQTSGIGLRNVEERLRSVYGDDFDFHAAPREDIGYSALIEIPLTIPPVFSGAAVKANQP